MLALQYLLPKLNANIRLPKIYMELPEDRDRTSTLSPATLIVLVFMLGVVIVQFGMHVLIVAKKGEMRDFAAYYTAAVVARTGASFYDPQPGKPWFGENENPDLIAAAKQLGTFHRHPEFEHVHIFSYPPAMMFVFLPLTFFQFQTAKVAWLILSLLMSGGGLWLVARYLQLDRLSVFCLLFVAAVFHPLWNTIDLGQINALMFLFVTAFWVLYRQGNDLAAGIVLGIATAIRLHPGILILYLLWRKQFRMALPALMMACGLSVVALWDFGLKETVIYFTQVAPKFTTPLISVENHSLAGFLATVTHVEGWMAADRVVGPAWLAWGVAFLLVGATLLLLSSGPQVVRSRHLSDLELALIFIMIPLATPNTTINHLMLILPAIGILFDHLVRNANAQDVMQRVLVGAAVILIGVVDDFYVHPSLAHGSLILLAEIKFYGLVLLYATLLVHIARAWRIQS